LDAIFTHTLCGTFFCYCFLVLRQACVPFPPWVDFFPCCFFFNGEVQNHRVMLYAARCFPSPPNGSSRHRFRTFVSLPQEPRLHVTLPTFFPSRPQSGTEPTLRYTVLVPYPHQLPQPPFPAPSVIPVYPNHFPFLTTRARRVRLCSDLSLGA